MTAKHATLVQVAKAQAGQSRGQIEFNRLIAEIEKERRRLADWQATIPAYHRRYDSELRPLLRTFDEGRRKLVFLLDTIAGAKQFGKRDKRKLSGIIMALSGDLLQEKPDDALKQLYNRHSGSDFDAELAEEQEVMKGMMEEVLGQEFGDDIDSPEKLMEHFAAKMQEEQAREQKRLEQKAERRSARKQSSKSASRSAQQDARREEEALQVSQSIREVYRKLASALHPDREQEGAERDRKTALMQRVNVAYADKDLLTLLELQLEVEQIDQASINNLSAERLKHYNKVLSAQVAELRAEVKATEFAFKMECDIDPYQPVSPEAALQLLAGEIGEVRDEIASLNRDLDNLHDIKYAKRWLKNYQLQDDQIDEAMGGMFEQMLFGRGY